MYVRRAYYIVPDTYCVYLARETFKGWRRTILEMGKWNILTVYYTKQMKSLSIRHFVPLLFLLSLIVPLVMMLFYFPAVIISLTSLLLYLISISVISLSLFSEKKTVFQLFDDDFCGFAFIVWIGIFEWDN
jgi:membrane protein required for beta-lactamase induction